MVLRLVTIARFTGDRWSAGDPARHPSTIRSAATADGNVAERPAHGPVTPAALAEVARLAQAVVVVVAELGVAGAAARAPWGELDVGFRPAVGTGRQAMARRRHGWEERSKGRWDVVLKSCRRLMVHVHVVEFDEGNTNTLVGGVKTIPSAAWTCRC